MFPFHLEIVEMPMDFIDINLIGPFEVMNKGNQYALTVICALTNYVFSMPFLIKWVRLS